MVICIIALIVFSVLSLFSAKYRPLAKESFRCMFRMITFRPCESNLEDRIRTKITTKLIKPFPVIAKFTYRNFKLLSWVFVILFFSSLFLTARGAYNLAIYGTCDPHSTTCIFNPGHLHCGSQHCLEEGCTCDEIGCEEPAHKACEGNCTCLPDVCYETN